MKDGIYEQLLNNELKSKLNESEYFYKTNTILKSPENAKNLITEYLKEVTRKAMDCQASYFISGTNFIYK